MHRDVITLRKQIGENIKRLRHSRSISQEALADYAEVDRAYMSRLENGKVNPSIGTLLKVAIALEVEIADFLCQKK